jgi:hypothetical protein
MVHYCRKAKDPTLSLTHHCLVQFLIQRGFSQQNLPLNNPPINPQVAAEILKTPRSSNNKTPLTPQKYPIAHLQNQPDQPIPLPYQYRLIPYPNHPLPPFIFLVMILSRTFPPAPSLRKDPHENENKFPSFRHSYKKSEQGPQQGHPLLPLP